MAKPEAARRPGEEPVPVYFNEEAGRSSERTVAAVVDALGVAGISVCAVVLPAAALRRAVGREAARGAPLVLVAGGDGTVSSAAAELAGRTTALGVIPVGTLNHFASRLGIQDLDSAVRAVKHGRVARVAVGVVNGRCFVNNASCGFYAHVLRHRERWRRWMGKWPAAALASVAVGVRPPLLDVALELPTGRCRRVTPMVWVGIGRGSFRMPEAGRTGEAARELEVVVVAASTPLRLAGLAARALWRLVRGRRPAEDVALEAIHGARLRLDSAEPIDIALDGELARLPAPIEFRLEERALKVLTPLRE